MKTVRFANVVEASGAPETYLLWTPAANDKVFQRALKEHRVMTLHQELRGSKKDYGQVGFHEEANAQFLVFPKSLRRFEDRRVVGIDYALFSQSSRAASNVTKVPRDRKVHHPKARHVSNRSVRDEGNVVKFSSSEAPSAPAVEKKSDRELTTAEAPREESPRTAKKKTLRKAKSGKPVKDQPRESKTSANDPVASKRFVAEIEKAMRELRAGKSVPAYERLATLVRAARGHPSAGGDGNTSR